MQPHLDHLLSTWFTQGMWKLILAYGVVLAALAFVIGWLDYKHATRAWSTEFYVACIAVLCVALGIWVGNRLTARPRESYARNDAAIASLSISAREIEVLDILAAGHANKVIARRLDISPNTVKKHIARLFEKLDVASRTQAKSRVREPDILPKILGDSAEVTRLGDRLSCLLRFSLPGIQPAEGE